MSIMSMLVAGGGGAFTPLSLFSGGVQGVWYDPSDLTTMFQDSAGTTPVGTPGNGSAQPVGKILDKSGNGNHATQSTASARPELSARYNLLTYTEQFDNGVWSKYNCSITANATTDPLGGSTADAYSPVAGDGAVYETPSIASSTAYTYTVYLKQNAARYGYVYFGTNSTRYGALFDLQNGTFVASYTTNTPMTGTGYGITSAGSGWYQVKIYGTFDSSSTPFFAIQASTTSSPTIPTTNGSLGISNQTAGSGIYVWGADCRVSNDGVGLPAYQRVVDTLTYDAVGFPYYLSFDGANRFMQCDDTNMPTGDLSFFSGSRCNTTLSDFTNNGIIGYGQAATGKSVFLYYVTNSVTGSVNAVGISQYGDSSYISNSVLKQLVFSVNRTGSSYSLRTQGGANTTSKTMTTATAVYGTNGFGLGRWGAGTPSAYLNGRIYGVILRGASSTATEISNTETWVNGKTKAY